MKKTIPILCLACLLALSACSYRIMDMFQGTPHLFVAQDGEVIESISPVDHEEYFEDEETFDALLVTNELIDEECESGEYVQITYAEFLEMVENGEHFIAIVTQTYCSSCNTFKSTILDDYVETHGITMYEINVTNEDDPEGVWDLLGEYIEE